MFQLIVAVISIALVATLAIASTYYGGTAFTKSQMNAQITALVNSGEQIAAANELYIADWGSSALSVADLVAGKNGVTYLASAPVNTGASGGLWSPTLSTMNVAVRLEYTGSTLIAFCTAIAVGEGVLPGSLNPFLFNPYYLGDLPANVQYGCVGDSVAATFNFRLSSF